MSNSPAPLMSAVDRLVRVTNAHDLEGIVACFSDDYALESPLHPSRSFRGKEQVRRNWTQILGAIPDIEARILRAAVNAEDGSVWTEWEMSGTRRDGGNHLMRGVFIFGVAQDLLSWGRMFLEPVDESSLDHGRRLARPGRGAGGAAVILVVGGTGTLGREIVRRLVDAGSRVRVLTRERLRARGLPDTVEIAIGDLRDAPSIAAAIRGCEVVVSAAHGFLGPGNPSPEAIDRDGNSTLLLASSEAGVSHFVLVSVHGASPDHPMSLARAKYAAEAQLRASGVPFTIVRATPFMETWLNIMDGMLDTKGQVIVFGPGTNPVNFVSAADVAAAVAFAVAAVSPANETLEISGPDNVGLATLARQVMQARGKDAPIKHIPLAALRALSILARPFSPSFARQAQAAVLMNTTDMAVSREAASNAGSPGIPTTTFTEVLARAGD